MLHQCDYITVTSDYISALPSCDYITFDEWWLHHCYVKSYGPQRHGTTGYITLYGMIMLINCINILSYIG